MAASVYGISSAHTHTATQEAQVVSTKGLSKRSSRLHRAGACSVQQKQTLSPDKSLPGGRHEVLKSFRHAGGGRSEHAAGTQNCCSTSALQLHGFNMEHLLPMPIATFRTSATPAMIRVWKRRSSGLGHAQTCTDYRAYVTCGRLGLDTEVMQTFCIELIAALAARCSYALSFTAVVKQLHWDSGDHAVSHASQDC